MNARKIITICLAFLFVLLLVATTGISVISVAFSPAAVERRLEKNGFYVLAEETMATEIGYLESVIGIPTADVLKTVPQETVTSLLKPYVSALYEQLLLGGDAPQNISFRADALYQLVCNVITADQYNGNTTRMEEDRLAAYTDLTNAIDTTLNFFPSTLFETAKGILGSEETINKAYTAIHFIKRLLLPAVLLTLLCGAGLFLCRRKEPLIALKTVAGCWSVTTAALFFASLFAFCGNHLLDKLSLADGLLRRFVVAIFEHAAAGSITVTGIGFTLGLLLLVTVILLIAVKKPCTEKQTVVE